MSKQPANEVFLDNIIFDLRGYDSDFLKECEHIFQINAWKDKEDGQRLREWVKISVCEIVGFYSLNPNTIHGSISNGPYIEQYDGMTKRSPEELQEFREAYQIFAVDALASLTYSMESIVNKAIDHGYYDIRCTVNQYNFGALVMGVYGIDYDDQDKIKTKVNKDM